MNQKGPDEFVIDRGGSTEVVALERFDEKGHAYRYRASPDGKWIARWSRTLSIAPSSEPTEMRIVYEGKRGFAAVWSHDSKSLALNDGRRLFAVSIPDGSVQTGPIVDITGPWAWDGHRVYGFKFGEGGGFSTFGFVELKPDARPRWFTKTGETYINVVAFAIDVERERFWYRSVDTGATGSEFSDWRLWLLDFSKGMDTPRLVYEAPDESEGLWYPQLMNDGRLLISDDGQLVTFAPNGTRTVLPNQPERGCGKPQSLSPSGDHVFMRSDGEDCSVPSAGIFELATGTTEPVLDGRARLPLMLGWISG